MAPLPPFLRTRAVSNSVISKGRERELGAVTPEQNGIVLMLGAVSLMKVFYIFMSATWGCGGQNRD